MGECRDQDSGRCADRHTGLPADMEELATAAPLEGVISFTVLRLESPVSYWVRLLQDPEDERRSQQQFLRLMMAVSKEFSKSEARLPVREVRRGEMVAVLGREGVVRRGRVERLVQRSELGGVTSLESVEVFAVDSGQLEVVTPCQVFALPASLATSVFPPSAIRLVVSGLRPLHRDTAWGEAAVSLVTSGLRGREGQEAVCRGRVLLQMAGTVWLDRAQLLVRQQAINRFVCQFETVRDLQDAGKMIDFCLSWSSYR